MGKVKRKEGSSFSFTPRDGVATLFTLSWEETLFTDSVPTTVALSRLYQLRWINFLLTPLSALFSFASDSFSNEAVPRPIIQKLIHL